MKTYRKGGVGAMMDEYERAAAELAGIVRGISPTRTMSGCATPHARSELPIDTDDHVHVVNSGIQLRGLHPPGVHRSIRAPAVRTPSEVRHTSLRDSNRMLAYTVRTLEGRWTYSDEQTGAVRINSRWGVQYDMEQILEHAIVHILRHRRQIERFLGR